MTTWAFDGLNRVTTETNALSDARSFSYNAAGDLTSRTDRDGRVTNYAYDNLHRRTQETWISGGSTVNTFSWNFDAASQLTSASATGTAVAYTFDNLGRVLTTSNSGTTNIPTTVLTNVYDADSHRTQQTATVSSTVDYKNTWTYDNADRQTQVKQEGQSGGNTVAAKRADYVYNTAGMMTGLKRYNDLAGTQIVANTTYTFDGLARLTALDHKDAGGTNLSNYSWTFDSDRRITSFTNSDGTSNFTYDTNDQVTAVDHSYQTDEAFSYSANGNRTNSGYSTGTNNQVTSDGTYNYTYDDEGNRTSRTKISDSTKVEYTWDHRNRLTDVVYKNGSGTVTKKVQYQYDVFNRRIGKKVDSNGDSTYDTGTYWAYDDAGKRDPGTGTALDEIVLEFFDSDGDGSGAAVLSVRYLHGPGVDQIVAAEIVSSNVVTWALADHQGTVRDMVRYASGTTTIVNHRQFDAFGNLTAESDATVKFLFSYTGREWDGDAGLYYYRARWYDAVVGRFIGEDPIGFCSFDTNLSRYVRNSSPNGTDPSGYQEPPSSMMAAQEPGEWYENSWNPWSFWMVREVPNWLAGYEPLVADAPIRPDLDPDGLPKGEMTTGSLGTYFGSSYDDAGKSVASHVNAMTSEAGAKAAMVPLGGGKFGPKYTTKLDPDILTKLLQFEKKSLGDQRTAYSTLMKTYNKHLGKYAQKAGETLGETERMERELTAMRRILVNRGRTFGPDGTLLD